MDQDQLNAKFSHQKVCFVTTKQRSYIRNVQEIEWLQDLASPLVVVASDSGNYLLRVLKAYVQSIKEALKGADVFFIGFAPQLMLPLFWLYRRRAKILAIDFFISLYDTFVDDRKVFSAHSVPAKILHWMDQKTLELADVFVADTKAHRDFFVSEFRAHPARGAVMYLRADTSIYHPMQVAKPQELADKFVVLYFGSVLPLQGVDVVLKAAQLCEDDPAIHFIVIGPVARKTNIDPKAYPNVTFYQWLDQKELAEKIAMADLCLAGHFNGQIQKARRTIAGKTYIYKAMNKPVILGDNAANRELYAPKEGQNDYVAMGDAQALADRIKQRSKHGKEDF